MILFLWFLCFGLSYSVSMDEENPSISKQFKVVFYSIFAFPLMLGWALKEHMNNVEKIKNKLTRE